MAITTYSKFYFGSEITEDSLYLNFKEGAGDEITVQVPVGGYSLQEAAQALQDALNEGGALDYVVTVNRSTRIFTITASDEFTVLAATGANSGQSAWPVFGFTADQVSTADVAVGDAAVGEEYRVQFKLQSYLPSSRNRRALSAVVSRAASGKRVSVQKFGDEVFTEFNIVWVTDRRFGPMSAIRDNSRGIDACCDFMTYAITKDHFEFMPDENDPDTFETLMLESTPDSREGTGFKLKEYVDRGMPGFWETGLLVCKVIEE